ncbi:MAG: SH3 domain-containing protein [Pseudomonadales bacterium]|nr:SH3 domain-containing protein [Pseudomonadales bacterium]MCP5185234.1 SH3 domain-containing protein [Pseudomonadales bacterium]
MTNRRPTFDRIPRRCRFLAAVVMLCWQGVAFAWFGSEQPQVRVTEPYMDMHTGPGRGYPVFYVAGKGEQVTVIKRRTDWFKVRTRRGREGWVPLAKIRSTVDAGGDGIDWGKASHQAFIDRRIEIGFSAGDFDGARSLTGYVGYALTPNILVQLEGGKLLGDFSDGEILQGSVQLSPFPEWRVSPFFSLGTGIIRTHPHSTIVRSEDREDEIVHAGLGAHVYLTDRFVMRVEYRRHTVLTSRDENQEVDQWKAGFSVFF